MGQQRSYHTFQNPRISSACASPMSQVRAPTTKNQSTASKSKRGHTYKQRGDLVSLLPYPKKGKGKKTSCLCA
jgi:hypothetical protein